MANGSVLLRGARVIDPDSDHDGPASILIRHGRIAAWNVAPEVADDVIDLQGQVVTPGFVDLHTHLRFPGFPDRETVASGTAAAAAGGFTTVCAMANTDPVVDTVDVLHHVLAAVEREAAVRVRQLASVTYGLQSERVTDLPALAAAGAVAFSDDGKPVRNGAIMRAALTASGKIGCTISVHEEDPQLVGMGVANTGDMARRLGLPEWPCVGEASMAARDLALLEEVGGHVHLAHVSCPETVELIREAKGRGLTVTAEATPHHLCLTDDLLAGRPDLGLAPAHPNTKVNPPLRSEYDRKLLVEALRDGTIDAVATDHAPHSEADKALPFRQAAFGFTALETALPLLLDLVRGGTLELGVLISRLTTGPSRVFKLDAGTLRPGAPADICVFDPDAIWNVTPEALRSMGKNTPVLGATLRGRVSLAVVGGAVVYRAGDLRRDG